jgi:hypothetical protein
MSKFSSKFKTIPRKKEKEETLITFPNQKKEMKLHKKDQPPTHLYQNSRPFLKRKKEKKR